MNSWVVEKFGGTSVASSYCIKACIEILKPIIHGDRRVAVVVSAMGGKPKVTDMLLDTVHAAAAGNIDEQNVLLGKLLSKHEICITELLDSCPIVASGILDSIKKDIRDIIDLLRAVSLMKTAHEQVLEIVSGYGEIWSAKILAAAMQDQGIPILMLNARDVLFVSEDSIGTKVHWEESNAKLREYLSSAKYNQVFTGHEQPHLVITGYIASTLQGVATTLKRDGSDFSASIFGKMLSASSITIWTDVSGVYSADPRRVSEAQIIPEISYTEAIELAYFGAKVIHPKTMSPAIQAGIPIYIRNTFRPEHGGTRIYLPPSHGFTNRERCVCGFTTIDNIVLMNVEGTGMIGVPGIAHRLFGALKAHNISVMFIAQASSEHSICVAMHQQYTECAKKAIEEAFFYELKQGHVSHIKIIPDCAIIAAVGEGMNNTPGVSGIFFSALGDASISVLSISQGCDERNIAAVVKGVDATRALRAVHSAFWLSSLDLSIGVVGTGRVGSAILQMLLAQLSVLNQRFGINIKIRGVANSSKMLLGDDVTKDLQRKMHSLYFSPKRRGNSIDGGSVMKRSHSNVSLQDIERAMSDEDDRKISTNLDVFLQHINSGSTPHSIIIDASTSAHVAAMHPAWLKAGCHVVTANKRAIASSLDLYNAVFSAARIKNRMYMSEVTIGASLPIRTTLNDLLCSGDAVNAIIGLMSVSAGAVLTEIFENDLSFTNALSKIYNTGLFEDDVFQDLEGTEAAQKLLILGRELGIPLALDDIVVEPLAKRKNVQSWRDLGMEFTEEDAYIADRVAKAKAKGCTLRYVQRIHCNPPAELGFYNGHNCMKASVMLEDVPLDSPLAMVKGAVYYFSFHTARYSQNPLVIQGPLSDSANTASGVIGDILRIAKSIGAKDRGPEALVRHDEYEIWQGHGI